ncbi:MAG: DUF2723 domain-containing protein [Acidobacteriota bacterium]
MRHRRKTGSRWTSVFVIALLASVYGATLLTGPGVHGDTAKFQYAGRHLATVHATGYPGYLLLNHAFTGLFPFGSLAWRANLLSAAFSLAASLTLLQLLRLLRASDPVAADCHVFLETMVYPRRNFAKAGRRLRMGLGWGTTCRFFWTATGDTRAISGTR